MENAEWAGHRAGAAFILADIAQVPPMAPYAPVVVLLSTLVMLIALARWASWVNKSRARLRGMGEIPAQA